MPRELSGQPPHPQQPQQSRTYGAVILVCTVIAALVGTAAWYQTWSPVPVDRTLAEDFLPRYWHLATTDPAKAYTLVDDWFKSRKAGPFGTYAARLHRYLRIDVSHIGLPRADGYITATLTYHRRSGATDQVVVDFDLVCPDSTKFPWNHHCNADDVEIHDTRNPFH